MRVYRVEWKCCKFGLYRCKSCHEEIFYDSFIDSLIGYHCENEAGRPSIHQDIIGYEMDVHYSGCESLDSLREWFRGFWTKIKKCDALEIVSYETVGEPLYAISDMQVGFVPLWSSRHVETV